MSQKVLDHKKDTWHLPSHRNSRKEEALLEVVPPTGDWTSSRGTCVLCRGPGTGPWHWEQRLKGPLVAWWSRPRGTEESTDGSGLLVGSGSPPGLSPRPARPVSPLGSPACD